MLHLTFFKNRTKLFIKEKQNTYPSPISLKTYVYNLRQEINYITLEEKINLLYNITII